MKRCSKCARTYSDDSLNFCLDDGTLLSSPHDSPTVITSQSQRREPPATEVLSSARVATSSQVQNKPTSPYLLIGLTVIIVGGVLIGLLWLGIGVLISASPSSKNVNTGFTVSTTSETPTVVQTAPVNQINITGVWQDNFGNLSQVTQQGNQFQVTTAGVACRGRFQLSGNGSINGLTYSMVYTSTYSQGRCDGNIGADGLQIAARCFDSACGEFQPIYYKR